MTDAPTEMHYASHHSGNAALCIGSMPGRATDWVMDVTCPPCKERLKDATILVRLAECENGVAHKFLELAELSAETGKVVDAAHYYTQAMRATGRADQLWDGVAVPDGEPCGRRVVKIGPTVFPGLGNRYEAGCKYKARRCLDGEYLCTRHYKLKLEDRMVRQYIQGTYARCPKHRNRTLQLLRKDWLLYCSAQFAPTVYCDSRMALPPKKEMICNRPPGRKPR